MIKSIIKGWKLNYLVVIFLVEMSMSIILYYIYIYMNVLL